MEISAGTRLPWIGRLTPVLVALGVWAWVFGLPFQLDDHTFLSCAQDFTVGPAGPHSVVTDSNYLFRPVQILWLRLWSIIDAVPLHPGLHHAASLLLHLVAVLLLHALLLRWTSRKAAFLGAILFATLPAGGEAIAWIGASGDLLVTAAGLAAACLCTRPHVGWKGWLGAGVLAGVGLLSKETMLSLLPALLLLAIFSPLKRSLRAQLLAAGLFLLPVILAWLFRGWVMGSLSFHYAGGRSLSLDAEQLASFAEKLPHLLRIMLAPFTPSFEQEHPPGLPWPRAVSLCLVGIPAIWGALQGRRGFWAIAAFGVLLPAPLFAAPPNEGEVFLRSLYLPGAALALLWAIGIGEGLRRGRGWGVMALAFFVGAMIVNGEGVLRMRSLWLEVGGEVRAELDAIEKVRAEDAARPVVVLGSPDGRDSVPMLGNLVQQAMESPFRSMDAGVIALKDRRALLGEDVLIQASATVPITILEFNRRGALVCRTDLPAGHGEGVAVGPDADGWWRFSEALVPRAAPEIALSFGPGPAATISIELAFADHSTQHQLALPEAGEARATHMLLDQDEAWMLSPGAPRVRITGAALAAPPRAGRAACTMAIVKPTENASLTGGLSELEMAGVPEGTRDVTVECHVCVGGGQWMTALLIGARVPEQIPGADTRTWRHGSEDRVESPLDARLRPDTIAAMAREHLRPLGLGEVILRVRVEARSADGAVLARSGWRTVRFAY